MAKTINLGLKLLQVNRLAEKLRRLKGEAEKARNRVQKLEASAAATEARLTGILGGSGKPRKRRKLSKAARARIGAAAKKRWTERRAKKNLS